MARSRMGAPFPIGLLVAAVAILAYKAISLSLDISADLGLVWRFVSLDLDLLGILLLAGLTASRTGFASLRYVLKGLLLLAVFYYVIHTVVLLELDEAMSLFDLARYLPEWSVVRSFLGPGAVLAVSGLLLSALIDMGLKPRRARAVSVVAVVSLLAGLVFTALAPIDLRKYSMMQLGRVAQAWRQSAPAASYTPEQRDRYASAAPRPATFMPERPNIILLIVESLSSINSKRSSGVFDLMPAFDELSEQGVLFPNAFANHAASEGGIISLLSGFPPLHYPTASPLMFDEFAMQPAVVQEYQAQGYAVEFMTNADLAFIGLDRYIEGLGLDRAAGREEVPAFRDAPRLVQDAPSDRLLYQQALHRVDARSSAGSPWLLVLATVSTHLPYTHPEGGEDSAEAVWSWTLEQLVAFHEALDASGFYRDGVLLVTGDHRQMRPLSEAETRRYGDSARMRVPLLLIGMGAEPGRVDPRWVQQADLLRYLPRLWQPDEELSPNPIWVERYNRIYGTVENINQVGVFDASNDARRRYALHMFGSELSWVGPRPPAHRRIETGIHAQRSAHQFRRNGEGLNCSGGGGGQQAPAQVQLVVPEEGTYWFRAAEGISLCLVIDGQLLVEQRAGAARMQAPMELAAGAHEVELYFPVSQVAAGDALQWVTPGTLRWRWRRLSEPAIRDQEADGNVHHEDNEANE